MTSATRSPNPKRNWTIQAAAETYRIARWGDGYFDIETGGKLRVRPDRGESAQAIAIQDVVDELRTNNVEFPVVMRFHDVLISSVRRLNQAFANAIAEMDYAGEYRGVYPIKVNQMREVVDEVVAAGRPFHYGLEAGSKPELAAVLSYDLGEQALVVCNGYKDEDFLKLALLGTTLGRKVVVVIEKFSEIEPLLRLADQFNVQPMIGLRVKMRLKTVGRWSDSSGVRAKFGLTIQEMLQAVELIQARGYGSCIRLLHFHVGSQLSDIRYVQEAVQEGARIYVGLCARGVRLGYFDIGGGLAVDYDGSRTGGHSSMNYSLQEYAGIVVRGVKQVCDLEGVAHPNLVSESGRAVSAYHSCVVMRVFGEITSGGSAPADFGATDEHLLVVNLRALLDGLSTEHNYQGAYNQASQHMEDVLSAFKLGVLGLDQMALAESLYWRLLRAIAQGLQTETFVSDDLDELQRLLASQYLCNFSLFQSAADSWAIQQVLPVVPLARLHEAPTRDCSLADITCDSDGRVNHFLGEHGPSSTVPLHALDNREYYIGLFLTGAYQDVMGDMHNLFGRVNEAHIFSDPKDPAGFYVEELVSGASASQVLKVMQYHPEAMATQVKKAVDRQISAGTLRARDGVRWIDFYESCLAGYTYLKVPAAN